MQNFDRNDDEPLDPAVERVRQKMARLQLVSLFIMFMGLFAVFAVIIYKVWYEPSDTPATVISTDQVPGAASFNKLVLKTNVLALPPGAQILETSLSGSNLLIRFEQGPKMHIWIYDISYKSFTSQLEIKQ